MATSTVTDPTAVSSNGHVELPRPGLGRRAGAEGLAAFALVYIEYAQKLVPAA